MTILKASEHVADSYAKYASYVNSFRAIPDTRDGLKVVQRRILQTLLRLGNHGSLIASASVVGDCIKYYHPHSADAIYGAIVNMVNDPVPWIQGKGNFGSSSGLITTGAAAFRYTKVGLNNEGKKLSQLSDFSDMFENENEYQEASYLPVIFPYCLLEGAAGIGVGCVTSIPPINLSHLKQAVVALIEGKKPRLLEPVSVGGGSVVRDNTQIDLLNNTGKGSFIHKADMKWEWDKESGQNAIVITNVPSVVNLRKLEVVLKDEIEQDLIFVRNESSTTQRIVVSRNKRVRRISDQELWNRVERVTKRRLNYVCTMSHHGITRVMTPLQILETSLEYAVKANNRALNAELKSFQDEILYEKIKTQLVKLLQSDTDKNKIMKTLSLTDEQYSKFSGKSLSSMRKNKDVNKIKSEITNINTMLSKPKESTGKRFGVIK